MSRSSTRSSSCRRSPAARCASNERCFQSAWKPPRVRLWSGAPGRSNSRACAGAQSKLSASGAKLAPASAMSSASSAARAPGRGLQIRRELRSGDSAEARARDDVRWRRRLAAGSGQDRRQQQWREAKKTCRQEQRQGSQRLSASTPSRAAGSCQDCARRGRKPAVRTRDEPDLAGARPAGDSTRRRKAGGAVRGGGFIGCPCQA